MKKRHLLKVGTLLSLVSLVLFALMGTTSADVEEMSLTDLTSKASTILHGKVSKVEPHWNRDQTMIYTSVTVFVGGYLKGGTAAKEVTIEVPGGTVGEITQRVSGAPVFEDGQEVILFLKEEYFRIVGWFQGKFTVVDDMVVEKGIPVDQFTGHIKTIMEGSVTPAELSYSWVSGAYETPTDAGIDWVSGPDDAPIDPASDWVSSADDAPIDPASDWVSGISEHPRLQGVLGQLLDAYETDGPLAAQQVADVHAIELQDGKVLVVVESETNDMASLAQAIVELGGEIRSVASDWASALAPISALDVIASLPDVAHIRLPLSEDAASEYYRIRTITLEDGTGIDEITINGPPKPPPGYKRPIAKIPDKGAELQTISTLSGVPAFDWSYGCSATSAAMIAGYYDRTGYANMYAGPTNGGVMPLDNSAWGAGENPLSATHQGYDGRATKGHVDDYWIGYLQAGPDPFDGNWTEHTYGDSTGDYMKTNQWINPSYGFNVDGSTVFYNYTSGAPLHWNAMEGAGIHTQDGGYGLKLFYESRGYTVTGMYNQYIKGQGSNPALGFTYDQYKAEIDAGRPVMIHVVGHTMVGFGYNDATNLMYIHDTWDYSDHTMTWGGSYSGMQHYSVTIVQLAAASCTDPPTTPHTPSPADDATDVSINADLSWSGGHPCPGESVTYDVYFEANDSTPDNLICDDVSSTTCDPGTLGYDTHYYWKVVANGLNGPSEGPVWDFTTEEPGADLAISKTDDPDPVIPGNPLTYTIAVTNSGPLAATGVVVTDTLPLAVTFASASASQGTCSGTDIITCDLGTINNGGSATVTIVVTPTASGTFTNTASVASGVTDPNTANNSATASTTACYDFSGNGVVDAADIQLVASRWRCKCGDTCYDPLYDLNGDCDIDVVDIMLIVAHWGETCP